MKYDYKTLYEKNAEFFNKRKTAKKILLASNLFLTGVFFLVYGIFLWQAIAKDFLAEELLFILGAPALCLFLVTVLRYAVDRPRPYDKAGANIQPILHKKSGDRKSFPSRHLACAFVLATVILQFWIGAGICLLLFGAALGYVRFALGVHYPSDLFGGALLGVLCALLCAMLAL